MTLAKYMKEKWTELKGEIIVGNTPLSIMHRTTRKKEIENLTQIISNRH